jgi:chemotaxis signal transduction protein
LRSNRHDQRQFTTFYADERYFGIDVMKVQEVLRYQR